MDLVNIIVLILDTSIIEEQETAAVQMMLKTDL